MTKVKKPVFQRHHLIYQDEKNKEVVRNIRKGVHLAISWIRKFTYLTDEEVSTIKTEAELKRVFKSEEKL